MKYLLILLGCLLLGAMVWGDPHVTVNPGCPQWAQKYKDVQCK